MTVGDQQYSSTVRCSDCHLLTDAVFILSIGTICQLCFLVLQKATVQLERNKQLTTGTINIGCDLFV